MLVCAGALVLRVAYVLLVTRHQGFPSSMAEVGVTRSYDEAYYVQAADSIANGTWFRFGVLGPPVDQAAHPPLTSLALAPVRELGGSELVLRLVMAVVGTVTVGVIGLTGRVVAGARAGLVAAGLAAVYPNLWMNDGLIMAETGTALTTALAVLATLALLRDPTVARAAAVGLCCGLAALARSELVLLAPLVAVVVLARPATGTLAARARSAGVVVVVAAVVVAPWVGYNLSRFEEPVLLSHADGDVLIGANCASTYYGDRIGLHDGECGIGVGGVGPGGETADHSVDAKARREVAFEYIRDHADRLPVVVVARLGRMWSVYAPRQMAEVNQAEGRPLWASYAGLAMFWALVACAAVGVARLRDRRLALLPILAPVVIVTVNAMVFFGFVRHRVPAEISLVLLAAIGIDHLIRRRHAVDQVDGPVEDTLAVAPAPTPAG